MLKEMQIFCYVYHNNCGQWFKVQPQKAKMFRNLLKCMQIMVNNKHLEQNAPVDEDV